MLLKVDNTQPEMQLFIEMTGDAPDSKVLPMVENARYPDFARRLKDAMQDKGITVTDVKSALGVSYEMARRYTLGTAMPRDDKMRRLGEVVSRSAAYLQFGAEQSAPHPEKFMGLATVEPAKELAGPAGATSEEQEIFNEIASREIPEGIREAILTLVRSSPKKKNTD